MTSQSQQIKLCVDGTSRGQVTHKQVQTMSNFTLQGVNATSQVRNKDAHTYGQLCFRPVCIPTNGKFLLQLGTVQ